MKIILQKLLAAVLLMLGLSIGQSVEASHLQGAELTYSWVAPNVYQVVFTVYRDCSGIALDPTYNLSIQCVSGGAARTVVMNPTGNSITGTPYCPASGTNVCSGAFENYQTSFFSAIITFTASERACNGGMVHLSVSTTRQQTKNLLNFNDLYAFALINLTTGINNNSPQFFSLPVPFISVNKPIAYSCDATDVDGDSLVYSLRPSLSGFNTLSQYNTGFTYLNPITANPGLTLDSKTGYITLTPTVLQAGSSSSGYNKYVIVVQVDEYRKLNGAFVIVGSVRHDMIVTVVDGQGNNNPNIFSIVFGNQIVSANDVLNIQAGQTFNLQFVASDQDPNDILEISSDIATVLPGSTLNVTSGQNPTGTISFTTIPAFARTAPYYFNLIAKDNSCRLRGYQMKTIGLRISQNGGVNGTKNEIESLSSFVAYPNPSRADVSFKITLKKETSLQNVVIYNSLGQEVERLSVKALNAGENSITWPNAYKHAAGTYTAQLISADKTSETIQFSKLQ